MIVRGRLSNRARCAGRYCALLHEQEMIAVDETGRVAFSAAERARSFALAANVIAVLAAQQIEFNDGEISIGLESMPREKAQRYERGLGRISGSYGHSPAFQIRNRSNITVSAGDYDRGQIAIGVAHTDRFRAAARCPRNALCLEPRQRRVPRDVDLPGEKSLHLAFVVRVQHVVERKAAFFEIGKKAVPDRDDFRIVGDSAEQQRTSIHSLAP